MEPIAGVPVRSNPFPGLRPFREDEEYLFFGRESQVDAMVNKLVATRFLAVVGTSGSGKSSLVNCGLRPALHGGLMARAGTSWRMAQFRPGNDPLRAMADALASDGVLFRDYQAGGLTLAEIVDTTLRMSKLGLIDIYEQARLGEDVNLLVVVDQFEELFRYRQVRAGQQENVADIAEQATAFVNLLLEAGQQTTCRIYVVLTMRSDFLGDCAQFPGLAEAINAGQYLVPRMTREERRAAITGPVGVGGAEISPVLLTRLVNDVGDNPDQLSILQHALNRTWARWQHEGGTGPLDMAHYEAIGTMAHALDQHAERAYAELDTARRQELCEKIFKALTDKATDPRGVRRPTTLGTLCALADATAAEVTAVIEVFRKPSRSFLMPPAGEALETATVVDISHESLMRVWQRLNAWADEEAQSAQTYRRLADTAALHAAGKAGLWRDPDLTYARGWQARELPNATWAARYAPGFDDACAFLRDSEAAHAAELEEERKQAEAERTAKERELEQAKALAEAQRQRADEQAAASIRQRRLSWGLAAILALALGAAGFGWHQMVLAQKQSTVALAYLANSGSYKAARKDPSLGGLLALQGLSLARSVNDRTATTKVADQVRRLMNNRLLWSSPPGDDVNAIAFTPDGQHLVAASGKLLRIWDVKTGGDPTKSIEYAADVKAIAFTPDGTLVAGDGSGAVRLWDIQTGHEKSPPDPMKHPGISALALGPQNLLATGSATESGHEGSIVLWNVATGIPVLSAAMDASGEPFGQHDHGSFVDLSLAGTGNDSRLAAADVGSRRQTIWNISTRPPVSFVLKGAGEMLVNSVAFSRDGKLLATGDRDNVAHLWNGETGEHLEALRGHTAPVRKVAFNRDGSRLATASEDGTVVVWDTEKRSTGEGIRIEGKQLFQLYGHKNEVLDVEFSPDGRRLATAGKDRTVKVWNAEAHAGAVYGVAFSPDKELLATASGDRTIGIWSVTSRKLITRLVGHRDKVKRVAFSPDGHHLASVSDDTTARIWDLSMKTALVLKKGDDKINDVDYSPDGKWLATAGANYTAVVWDAATWQPKFVGRHDGTVSAVAFSPDSKFLASAGDDGMMKIWDISSGAPVACAKWPPEDHNPYGLGQFPDVNFSPDGNALVMATGQGSVYIVDGWRNQLTADGAGTTGRELDPTCAGGVLLERRHLVLEGEGIESAQFSPDGKSIVTTGSRYQVAIWDPHDGKRPNDTIMVHFPGKKVNQVALSKDG
ncbi:MAG TPA: hypothetical protein VKD72_06340, partial [Gemmataceae bacterium]|nr:hypothetical protein [Gemmataceae bacterium]